MAPHSSTLAWRIPWMEEPGRLQSMGSLRVGHDLAAAAALSWHVHGMCAWSCSRVRLFATPWTVAYQAPPPVGFSRQEYWSGLPFPSPGGWYTRPLRMFPDILIIFSFYLTVEHVFYNGF